jgi:hypothetical protein
MVVSLHKLVFAIAAFVLALTLRQAYADEPAGEQQLRQLIEDFLAVPLHDIEGGRAAADAVAAAILATTTMENIEYDIVYVARLALIENMFIFQKVLPKPDPYPGEIDKRIKFVTKTIADYYLRHPNLATDKNELKVPVVRKFLILSCAFGTKVSALRNSGVVPPLLTQYQEAKINSIAQDIHEVCVQAYN